MRPFSLLPFSGISVKPFVNDLSTSGIAICRPRRHRRHHDLARGFTDCLNFLLTATAPRHSRNGKNINVHSRHIGLWKSSLQNQRSQIRGVAVIDTCVILDHSPPYQGRVACGQSSVLVFEWEWRTLGCGDERAALHVDEKLILDCIEDADRASARLAIA